MNPEKNYNSEIRKSVEELKRTREKTEVLGHEHWPLYDSGLANFAQEFMSVTPCDEKAEVEYPGLKMFGQEQAARLFVEYIRTILKPDSNHHLNALELGGPGSKLFSEFPEHFFEKSVGACLKDTKHPIDEKENGSGHKIIRGDLFSNDTYKKIENAFSGKGADLIISRIAGGLGKITHNPAIWANIARKWYKLLREGGLMFVQFRFLTEDKWISDTEVKKDSREKLMKEWVGFMQDNYGKTIEIQLGHNDFRLLKKEGAPDELPILESFDQSPIIEKR